MISHLDGNERTPPLYANLARTTPLSPSPQYFPITLFPNYTNQHVSHYLLMPPLQQALSGSQKKSSLMGEIRLKRLHFKQIM